MEDSDSTRQPAADTDRLGSRVRTLLIGNNARFLAVLASFLGRQPGIEVVGQAKNGWKGLNLACELEPQLVLSDFTMEDMTGAVIAKVLKGRHKPPRVIVLSRHESHIFAEISTKAGADAFILKQQLDRLPEVLRRLETSGR
jgi:DNA-binding NarL/FixJ family response regulator